MPVIMCAALALAASETLVPPRNQADVPWWQPQSCKELSELFPEGALRTEEMQISDLFQETAALGRYYPLTEETGKFALPPFSGALGEAANPAGRVAASSSRDAGPMHSRRR